MAELSNEKLEEKEGKREKKVHKGAIVYEEQFSKSYSRCGREERVPTDAL